MKNITLSVEDDVYHAARVEAARHRTNVTAVLRGYLTAFVKGEAKIVTDSAGDEDRKNREHLVELLRECKLELGYKPSRERTYEDGRFSRF